MNGGAGERFWVRTAILRTSGCASPRAATWSAAVASSVTSSASPSMRTSSAANVSPAAVARIASIVQYSRAVNASMARSRSTTRRTATDWTRPADRPPMTLRDSSGLSV